MTVTMTVSSDMTNVWLYDCNITLILTLDSKIENKLKIKLN